MLYILPCLLTELIDFTSSWSMMDDNKTADLDEVPLRLKCKLK
jgi:hypothetical protein